MADAPEVRQFIAEMLMKHIVDDGTWSNGWEAAFKITDDLLDVLAKSGREIRKIGPSYNHNPDGKFICPTCGSHADAAARILHTPGSAPKTVPD